MRREGEGDRVVVGARCSVGYSVLVCGFADLMGVRCAKGRDGEKSIISGGMRETLCTKVCKNRDRDWRVLESRTLTRTSPRTVGMIR
jgi:hypothetical protein